MGCCWAVMAALRWGGAWIREEVMAGSLAAWWSTEERVVAAWMSGARGCVAWLGGAAGQGRSHSVLGCVGEKERES